MEQMTIKQPPLVVRIYGFYRDGFRQMTIGRTLWKIIFIKLFIMFGVLKMFFFHDFLAVNFDTDKQRADYVLEQITQPAQGVTTSIKGETL